MLLQFSRRQVHKKLPFDDCIFTQTEELDLNQIWFLQRQPNQRADNEPNKKTLKRDRVILCLKVIFLIEINSKSLIY